MNANSNAAFKAIQPYVPTLEERILDFLFGVGGATDEEMRSALNMHYGTHSSRRRSLVLKGRVRDSGDTRLTTSGRPATVWEIAS
jgi:hypothetical protein